VGSYAQLTVGDLDIASFKNDLEPWVALVFTGDDWRTREASAAEREYRDEVEPWNVHELVAPVDVVRDRLEITGATWSSAVEVFDEIVRDTRERLIGLLERFEEDEIRTAIENEIEFLLEFRLNDWVQALASAPADGSNVRQTDVGTRAWLVDLWSDADVRLCLRAALECRPDDLVVLDATELIGGGWLSRDHDPRDSALLYFGWAQTEASPIIVLTEGQTDARILGAALRITYPHLRGFIRFADFSHQPESNAGALVRTVKAFAAAGVANRVVALFDADTAARDATRSLRAERPASIKVLHLPPLELARSYPTIGTEGAAIADVNGRGCSIELYLGRDVLEGISGALPPVRWTAFVDGIGDWQGVVERKSDILERFWAKVEVSSADPSAVMKQDWSGLRAIIDEIRHAFVTADEAPTKLDEPPRP
jgi:hypothetical protein